VAHLSSQQDNNSRFMSPGRGQLPLFSGTGQAIWTTIIDSIDNNNFAVGLKNYPSGMFLKVDIPSSLRRPAAVKITLLLKEALCSIGSKRVRCVGVSGSYPTDHLGSFVRSVAGTVVFLRCRRSSSRTFFGDSMDRHIGRATPSKEVES
jgi:hypothetical protein